MTEMTTARAAARLGVSRRQVQRLIASGELKATRTAGDAWMVDALAVNALSRARPSQGRPWSARTAWAALWLLSGLEVTWLDRRSMSRLSARLEAMKARDVVHATRRRATVRRFRMSESFAEPLKDTVALTGPSATTQRDFDMAPDPTRVDGYVDEAVLSRLVRNLHLVEDTRGNVTLRAAPLRDLALDISNQMPTAVVAVDLADSPEARERAAGLRVLKGLLS